MSQYVVNERKLPFSSFFTNPVTQITLPYFAVGSPVGRDDLSLRLRFEPNYIF